MRNSNLPSFDIYQNVEIDEYNRRQGINSFKKIKTDRTFPESNIQLRLDIVIQYNF